MKWDIGRIHLINNMILSFTKCPNATTYDTYAEKNISTVGFGYLISDKPIVVPEGRLIFLTLDDFGHSITRQGNRIKTQQHRKHQIWEACGMGYQQELVTWMIPNHWAIDLPDEATEIMDPSFMDYLGSRPSGTEGYNFSGNRVKLLAPFFSNSNLPKNLCCLKFLQILDPWPSISWSRLPSRLPRNL